MKKDISAAMVIDDIAIKDRPKIKLVGEDGNAFFIMGKAVTAMRSAKYPKVIIDAYIKEAMSGDYSKLLQTTMTYCKAI